MLGCVWVGFCQPFGTEGACGQHSTVGRGWGWLSWADWRQGEAGGRRDT